MIRTMTAAVLLATTVAGCAGMSRINSYGFETADARHNFGGRTFSVYVHPTEDTLLIQPSIADMQASVSDTVMRLALEDFIKPTDCRITAPVVIAGGSWEAHYTCKTADLRRLIQTQKASLVAGSTLVSQ